MGGGRVGDLNVLQVQQAELDLHAEQGVQVVPRQVAQHVLPQQCVQPVRPDAVLAGEEGTMTTTEDALGQQQELTLTTHRRWAPCSALGLRHSLKHAPSCIRLALLPPPLTAYGGIETRQIGQDYVKGGYRGAGAESGSSNPLREATRLHPWPSCWEVSWVVLSLPRSPDHIHKLWERMQTLTLRHRLS